jgi:hypothetical protein
MMQPVWLHQPCKDIVEGMLGRAAGGDGKEAN